MGPSAPGDAVTVRFMDKVHGTEADAYGRWRVSFRTGNAGGPYNMVIQTGKGEESVTINDVLLGDVWLCSGQSNMGMRMLSVKDVYPEEIARSGNDSIRQFSVPVKYDFEEPQDDYESGSWVAADPQSVLDFTAVGYFFAARLFEEYGVPIGLIHASHGGAPIEAFISEEALSAFPECVEAVSVLKDKAFVEALERGDQSTREAWIRHLNRNDAGLGGNGKPDLEAGFFASDWPDITVPSYWADEGSGQLNGVVWFRKDIELPPSLAGEPAKLFLGHIIDEDTVYVNGTFAGSTLGQYTPRKYEIPEGCLRAGKNTLVVRVVNASGRGGFYKGKPYHLAFGETIVDLSGEWQYRIGARSEPLPAPAFVQWRPLGLYNGMIAPSVHYVVKGAVWYQGESNAKNPGPYERLFKAMIEDWREKRDIGDFPFLYVQLPNYMEPSNRPVSSGWAAIREAQRKTLALPATGMAVAIDLGEWNDIHPVNKRDVGQRLALAAGRVAYGNEAAAHSGPMFKSAAKEGSRILLSFDGTGGGLTVSGGNRPAHFAVAGADNVFLWAEAAIEGDVVAVWNDQIADPVHVRYAWADNPAEANLYNREGLPASPFTTE